MDTTPALPLRAWLDAAWQRHDKEPRALADELTALAATLPDDAEGAEAVRLARHTMVGHLADPAALQAFLARLGAGEQLAAMRARAEWVLATLAGAPGAELAAATRYGLLADVALAEIEAGRLDSARSRLVALEPEATTQADGDARSAYAATCNNLALALRTGPRGDPARDALMLEFAGLARRAWIAAGTWMHEERAEYQLAMCHAVIGQGAEACAHAAACLRICEAQGADAAERFFAHECSVHAERAAGNLAGAAAHRARMHALLAEIEDEGMKAWCAETLASTP